MKTTNQKTNDLTKQIKEFIESRGGYAERINVAKRPGRTTTNIGHPDLDCIVSGKAFKVEVKKDAKDKLRETQEAFKDRYEKAGGKVIVTWDIEHFINEFNQIKE